MKFPTALAFASSTTKRKQGPLLPLHRSKLIPSSTSTATSSSSSSSSPFPLFSSESAVNGDSSSSSSLSFENAAAAAAASATTSDEASVDSSSSSSSEADKSVSQSQSQSVLDRVRKISNFASFLCVLDCTLLPLVTVALPLLGVLNLGAGQLQAIDELGHSLALFFVLPVGTMTTVINYLSHNKKWISSMAIVGLTMVGLANSHIHIDQWPTLHLGGGATGAAISLDWMGGVLHKIQGCGTSPWHRIVNVSGCAFLLGSNYLSQQQDGCAAHGIAGGGSDDDDCGHSHDHSHDHNHGDSCSH